MKLIYLDNAATSFPKPPAVVRAVREYFEKIGVNAGRSAYRRAATASRLVFETRELVARLIHARDSARVIFTLNATEALNLAILGLPWNKGDHVITSSIEHNSVMRPLRHLEREKKIRVELITCGIDGQLDPGMVAARIQKRTRLVVMAHASNVIGAVLPVREIGRICRRRGVLFLVDAAQTAGKTAINVEQDNIDLLAFSGHKGLFGPPGTGCLYLRAGLELQPLKFGGTGSQSHRDVQPGFLPDKYECGTLNLPGIAGLHAGVAFVLKQGVERIEGRIARFTGRMLRIISRVRGAIVYGPEAGVLRTGTIAFNIRGVKPCEVGRQLDERHNIAVRVGMHCSPHCHRTIGTYPEGTVRVSVGFLNSAADIDVLGKALCRIAG